MQIIILAQLETLAFMEDVSQENSQPATTLINVPKHLVSQPPESVLPQTSLINLATTTTPAPPKIPVKMESALVSPIPLVRQLLEVLQHMLQELLQPFLQQLVPLPQLELLSVQLWWSEKCEIPNFLILILGILKLSLLLEPILCTKDQRRLLIIDCTKVLIKNVVILKF